MVPPRRLIFWRPFRDPLLYLDFVEFNYQFGSFWSLLVFFWLTFGALSFTFGGLGLTVGILPFTWCLCG